MTHEQATQLVARTARRLRLARLVKALLLAAAVSAVLGLWSAALPGRPREADSMALIVAVVAWVTLSAAGTTVGRLTQAAAGYTAAGRPDLAEQALIDAAGRFTLLPANALLAVQNLAALAHEAGQYAQATVLSRFLVDQARRSRQLRRAFERPGRLLLADAELMLGRLKAAYEQLQVLYDRQHTLAEKLTLLPVASYYEAAVGWWEGLAEQAAERARLAQLLPPAQAASTLGCLALGCQHTGQFQRRDWLWRQATLLVDRADLVERLPLLDGLPPDADIRLPWKAPSSDSGENQ